MAKQFAPTDANTNMPEDPKHTDAWTKRFHLFVYPDNATEEEQLRTFKSVVSDFNKVFSRENKHGNFHYGAPILPQAPIIVLN